MITPNTPTTQDHIMSDDFTSPLGRAIAIWNTGRPISLTLAVKLMEEGYDVTALERHHMKR